MNIDNIRKTIESLKASTTYDQADYNHPCGTPACIAGHAVVDAGYIFSSKTGIVINKNGDKVLLDKVALDWFGFSDPYLFDITRPGPLGKDSQGEYIHVPKEYAIAMLEKLIRTGVVDWNAINKKETT